MNRTDIDHSELDRLTNVDVELGGRFLILRAVACQISELKIVETEDDVQILWEGDRLPGVSKDACRDLGEYFRGKMDVNYVRGPMMGGEITLASSGRELHIKVTVSNDGKGTRLTELKLPGHKG